MPISLVGKEGGGESLEACTALVLEVVLLSYCP